MSGDEPVSKTFIIIIERAPEMPILYASSSIRQAILLEPRDVIGHSSFEYMVNGNDGEIYKKHHSSLTEDNVMVTSMFLRTGVDRTIFIRAIAFVCDNVTLHMSTSYPEITPEQYSGSVDVQRFKCILDEDETREPNSQSPQGSSVANQALDMNSIYSMRSSHQACMVLEGMEQSGGPKITFVTSSINKILDTESHDIQRLPFLSLVATEDITKASDFLARALNTDELVLESLRLYEDPVDEALPGNQSTVAVEFMAMASDDGVIMLCQSGKNEGGGRNVADGYMSLEDIISSGCETSDFPDAWNRFGLD
ncbi:hypothetical protein GGI12_006064 [Dipsacomyces acuminosporus]|nr:hypothetical protein GGI12_006064 [Dipsacomyces acuminosporus]